MRESLPLSKQLLYALGQLGWAITIGLVNSYLIYFYSPPQGAGIPNYIPQVTLFGFLTIIGLLTTLGRFSDAITDPLIATLSDRSKNPRGRRVGFMQIAALPLSVVTALLFFPPFAEPGSLNVLWLAACLFGFFIFFTMYVTPYFALIAELGHTPEQRLNLSTYTAVTFFLGTALAATAPMIWESLESAGMEKILALRITVSALCTLALVFMLIPVLFIDEKRYSDSKPSTASMRESLRQVFANKSFRAFAFADLSYFLALTILMTGLIYYVTVLLQQPESLNSLLIMILGGASFLLYPLVNLAAKKVGKKPLLVVAFVLFTVFFSFVFFLGSEGIPLAKPMQAYLLVILMALPMAVFSILPNAIVADIVEEDFVRTNDKRAGIFFGARTFMQKLGQMIAMVLFTSLLVLGKEVGQDLGLRLTGLAASLFCFLGLLCFLRYQEGKKPETKGGDLHV